MALVRGKISNFRPVQYLVGRTKFCGMWFELSDGTLIPRQETMILVDYIVNKYRDKQIRIIDLGTGSGNIAVVLAKRLSSSVYAIDISNKALKIARKNAKTHRVESRIKFYCNNWLSGLDIDPVDVIVSNPPYIGTEEWDSLSYNVKFYEPRVALFGGKDGLEHYENIIDSCNRFLVPGGEIVFEVGYKQAEVVSEIIETTNVFNNVNFIKDQNGVDRVVCAEKIY